MPSSQSNTNQGSGANRTPKKNNRHEKQDHIPQNQRPRHHRPGNPGICRPFKGLHRSLDLPERPQDRSLDPRTGTQTNPDLLKPTGPRTPGRNTPDQRNELVTREPGNRPPPNQTLFRPNPNSHDNKQKTPKPKKTSPDRPDPRNFNRRRSKSHRSQEPFKRQQPETNQDLLTTKKQKP